MEVPMDGVDGDMMIAVWTQDPAMRVWTPDALVGTRRPVDVAAGGRGRGGRGGRGRGGRGRGDVGGHKDASSAPDPSQEGAHLVTHIRNNNYKGKPPQRLVCLKRVPGSQPMQIDVVHFKEAEADNQEIIENKALAWMNDQMRKMAADVNYSIENAVQAKLDFMKDKGKSAVALQQADDDEESADGDDTAKDGAKKRRIQTKTAAPEVQHEAAPAQLPQPPADAAIQREAAPAQRPQPDAAVQREAAPAQRPQPDAVVQREAAPAQRPQPPADAEAQSRPPAAPAPTTPGPKARMAAQAFQQQPQRRDMSPPQSDSDNDNVDYDTWCKRKRDA